MKSYCALALLCLDLNVHALTMSEALQEAEEKARAEIALRDQGERKARQDAEHKMERPSGPARRADRETIEKFQREMMARVKAEQRIALHKSQSLARSAQDASAAVS